MKKLISLFLMIIALVHSHRLPAMERSNWQLDAGFRFFKYSAGTPNEINYNPVFSRWESINQNRSQYAVISYHPLEPLYFNMNFGTDLFIRYRRYLLLKLGYDYSNPLGIGGRGEIEYIDLSSGNRYGEEKEFSYTSHHISYFIGPVVPVDNRAEIYFGFSIMSPTWVFYRERYKKSENGAVVEAYDRNFKGMFGSCRSLMGIQITAGERIKLGSEAVFTFLNYMHLRSGSIDDYSFQFPRMKWNIVIRYKIFD